MAHSFAWGFDPAIPVDEFILRKSANNGLTWTALVTIPFDVNGVNFNKNKNEFFYTDVAGVPGDMYAIVARGANGDSKPAYALTPYVPPSCTVFGQLVGIGARNVKKCPIHFQTRATTNDKKWLRNPRGPAAVVGSITVYADENGTFQADLYQGAIVTCQIPSLDYTHTFEVPGKAGPVNLRELPEIQGAQLREAFGESGYVDGT